jgi:hypothetical protein
MDQDAARSPLPSEAKTHGTCCRAPTAAKGRPASVVDIAAGPTALVEPLKLVALIIVGEGHWLTGSAMIIAAYCLSLLLVERLFRVLKPKLMMMSWFARLWTPVTSLRDTVWPSPARERLEIEADR